MQQQGSGLMDFKQVAAVTSTHTRAHSNSPPKRSSAPCAPQPFSPSKAPHIGPLQGNWRGKGQMQIPNDGQTHSPLPWGQLCLGG